MVLERIRKTPLAMSSLFDLTSYVSDSGDLHVVIRGMVLGPGCKLCFKLPSTQDEWMAEIFLRFDPSDADTTATATALADVHVPQAVEAHLDSIHIDILDALQPCAADSLERHGCGARGLDADQNYSVPHLCELWITAAPGTSGSVAAMASGLVPALLFEKLPLQGAHSKAAAVMISPTMAEFSVPDHVSIMCICETDRLALRISSHGHAAYVSVVVAVIKRLALLLDVDIDNAATAGGAAGVLSKRISELGDILRGEISEQTSRHVDFAVIECAAPGSAGEF
ncbi:hypothetical protein LPJ53_003578 [Coemansia erecta]|uniref:Uncharacterized protein n=1 Tax=Coemansia erecta TaxID=147472 RepID=A0A9W8CQ20_9FUNG|nr:hypothetical protein LPJ53_003578 [Coemansia erecta]